MISINITKAPQKIYLGVRTFFFDQIEIGRNALVLINAQDINFPNFKLTVNEDTLEITSKESFDFTVDGKKVSTNYTLGKQTLCIGDFEISILDFQKERVTRNFKKELKKEIEAKKENPQFMSFLKEISKHTT